MLDLILATGNSDKIREMAALLAELDIRLHTAAQVKRPPPVEESEVTLSGNAVLKAKAFFEVTGMLAVADDTGLEVDALSGRPGVLSARYAGPSSDAATNRAKLLQDLGETVDRSARFHTVVAIIGPAVTETFHGVCEGRIVEQPRGTGGFGYDSLFQPAGFDKTFAEMTDADKNAISHRGQAVRKAVKFLRGLAQAETG
jgi:XTP/dITP diphosphohydrolase